MVSGAGCDSLMPMATDISIFCRALPSAALATATRRSPWRFPTRPRNLVHVSNLYYTEPQTELAEIAGQATPLRIRSFMANSGAEANEAAIKLARIASGAGRYEIITLDGSFHGRTLATVAATAQPKFHQGFEPLAGRLCPCSRSATRKHGEDVLALRPVRSCVNRCRARVGSGRWPKEYLQFSESTL